MRRIALILLVVLFALFAALWTYVQSDAFSERMRPWIVQPLQEVLGPQARIGRVKATLLPLVLELRDLALPSAGNSEAVAIRKIRIYINPIPLLWRKVSVTSVTVLEPRLAAQRGIDGVIDLQSLLRSVQANIEQRGSKGAQAFTVQVRSVVVRNGAVKFSDASSGVQAAITGLDFRAGLSAEAPAGVVRVTAGTLGVTSTAYPPFHAAMLGEGSFGKGKVAVSNLDLRAPKARVSASGTVVLGKQGPLDLRVTARSVVDAEVPAVKLRQRKDRGPVIEAAAAITGTREDPRLEGTLRLGEVAFGGMVLRSAGLRFTYGSGSATVSGEDWQLERGGRRAVITRVLAEADYRDSVLRIVNASLRSGDLAAQASGSISAEKGMNLSVSADIAEGGMTPEFLTGLDVAGAASVKGTLTSEVQGLRFEGAVSAGPVLVRGTAFQGLNGLLSYRNRTLSVVGATIRQDASRYLFDGSVNFAGPDPRYEARLGVIRSDVVRVVSLFYRPIPLDLHASGELFFSGTRSVFSGTGQLSIEAGSAYGESFDRGSLSVELTSGRIVFSRVVLEKGGGQVTGRGWIGFDGTYFSQIESSGIDLAQVDHLRPLELSGPLVLSIRSSGTFTAPVVQARASSPGMAHRHLGAGAAAAELAISERRMTVSASVDSGPEGAVSVNGAMRLERSYPWTASASFQVRDADLSRFTQDNEILARLRLTAEGTASLQGEGLDPQGISGTAVLQRVVIALKEYQIENEGEASFRIDRGTMHVRRLHLAGAGTKLTVAGALHPGRSIDLSLAGDVNLSLLRVLYREVEHGDGFASLRLAVREKWESPDVEGQVTLREGLLKIRDIPQKFSAINGSIVFDRNRIVTEGLTADVGGGRVTIAGSAQLQGSSLVEFSTRAVVENVAVRYPPGLTATMGGTLYYDGDASSQILSGDLSMQRAKYEKRIEWKSMLVDVTRGITRRKKTDVGWIGDTQLNIRFSGSENILFESNLAKIPVKIDMLFRGTVNQLQVLGRVEAREGEVYFRNNVFRILYASTDFVDPNRFNPVLDVQAETRVREYRIRLAVTGNADRAVVTFLSDPPLADSDILALLALGRRGEQLKGKEASVGMGESLSFATGKFQDLLESRARSITGLDRFQVDPYINKDETAVPRVTVGKELLPDKFYMTYSSNVGGTTPEQNVRVEYILNRNLSLIGEYDELGQIGADLKLRFEFR